MFFLVAVGMFILLTVVALTAAQQSTLTVAQFEELLTRNTWTGITGAMSSSMFSFTSDHIYVHRRDGFTTGETYGIWEVSETAVILFESGLAGELDTSARHMGL